MKRIFKTALYLSVMLMAGSCVLDQIDSQPAVAPSLKCDALESYTIQAAKPQDVSFRVSANTPWAITGFENANWVTVTPTSSAVSSLSEDIRIKTSVNTELSDRSVTLTVKGENADATYTIKLTQLRSGKLTVTPIAETDAFPMAGGTNTFLVEANMDWSVSAADSWLSFSPSSGTSDGTMKSVTVTATAEANKSINRSTLVSVTSGDEKFEFTVHQKGQSLEFLTDAQTIDISRKGGEIVLGVEATMDWSLECDNTAFTVNKEGSDKIRISAPWNNVFAPRKAKLTIKPVSSSYGDVSRSVELVQDINFTLQNCEVLDDGSVKMSGSAGSRVVTIDEFRDNFDITLTLDQNHFGTAAQLWIQGKVGDVNIYNQLTLGGNTRIRTDGNLAGGAGSGYKSSTYSITQSELNAMKTYRYKIAANAEDKTMMDMAFFVNGSEIKSHTGPNPFYYDSGSTTFYFGFYSTTTDGSWYVVKTCDVIPIAE